MPSCMGEVGLVRYSIAILGLGERKGEEEGGTHLDTVSSGFGERGYCFEK